MHVTLHSIPFADFMNNHLTNKLHISQNTKLTLKQDKNASIIHNIIILATTYLTEELQNYQLPSTIRSTNLTIIQPSNCSLNLYPITLYLTTNEFIKYINSFITLCHTTDPQNKTLIPDLMKIKELVITT